MNLPIRPYFGLKSLLLTIISLLVIFTSKNQNFAPKRYFTVYKH